MELNISATTVFKKTYNALANKPERFLVSQGGSSSSKTISIIQSIIIHCKKNPGIQIDVIRKTLPELKKSVMNDFFRMLHTLGIYDKECHNMTDNIYTFPNGSKICFYGADNAEAQKGPRRDIAWFNEANEISYDVFQQINLRTRKKVILDYNPSEPNSWVYEIPKEEQTFFKSTYKDNKFLSEMEIKQIENLKETDPELYAIYGCGERITPRQNVYAGWQFIDEKPERFTQWVYGSDYGFNDPTTFVKVWYYENELFLEEVMYERYLTAENIKDRLIEKALDKNTSIIAETARPEINAVLQEEGFYIINANKSIKEGINAVKTFKVYVSSKALNIKKEYESYKWSKKGENILDKPIDLWNHTMDAIRYAVLYIKNNNVMGSDDSPQFFSLQY